MKPSGSLRERRCKVTRWNEVTTHMRSSRVAVCSTHLDMGFTLASTIARTLQFLIFSGNSWIPGEKRQLRLEVTTAASQGLGRALAPSFIFITAPMED